LAGREISRLTKFRRMLRAHRSDHLSTSRHRRRQIRDERRHQSGRQVGKLAAAT
jgi:hypothetical protein